MAKISVPEHHLMGEERADDGDEAVELLKQLGLKEYEARAFVALTRLPEGTAREVSEWGEIPCPRVYDAMDVLESRGLIETRHTSPQKFRAIAAEEAIQTLRKQYDSRFDKLGDALGTVKTIPQTAEQSTQEVWTVEGREAVSSRTLSVVGTADEEVVLLVADEETLTRELMDVLAEATARGVEVFVGVLDETVQRQFEEQVPQAQVFKSGLSWLQNHGDSETRIGRFLLADRNVLLVSSLGPSGSPKPESAIWAEGLTNGLVVIARRLLQAGLDEQTPK
ncbi:Sugar-specific transcriptional regulator TrmB [Halogranum rubrum]|uniref:Sugar-specific transcriptional regulator TrmB n=1 Tax=Halogranum rubrum TaxID=553466 RepID=A0A1I4B244_9EURY|nr:helix-turn-helix domain-containing protein [Halogranum rubrum]SFK62141.1 Sugar-specific transcriptional regulator TrmB [Halogranum rubrum]